VELKFPAKIVQTYWKGWLAKRLSDSREKTLAIILAGAVQLKSRAILQDGPKKRKTLNVIPMKVSHESNCIEWLIMLLGVLKAEITQARSQIQQQSAIAFRRDRHTRGIAAIFHGIGPMARR
jgi:hypothetical protein